jgi:Txe/YoeB family toxin of toxin-antitoxin system
MICPTIGLMMYKIRRTKQAQKDAVNIERAGLKPQVAKIASTVKNNPYEPSQDFEKLNGTKKPTYSRRINDRHRFVYMILPNTEGLKNNNGEIYEGIVRVIRMWTHSTKK